MHNLFFIEQAHGKSLDLLTTCLADSENIPVSKRSEQSIESIKRFPEICKLLIYS